MSIADPSVIAQKLGSVSIFSLLLLLGASNESLGATSLILQGNVNDVLSSSGAQVTGCSYTVSAQSSDTCSINTNHPGGNTVVGSAASSVDSNGLHVSVSELLTLYGNQVNIGYPVAGDAFAAASFDDVLHIGPSATTSGFIVASLTSEGSTGGGGSAGSSLAAGQSSCTFLNAGSCTVTQAITFNSTITLRYSITAFAHTVVGGGNGVSTLSYSNFGNTSFVSVLRFTDSSGTPIQVSYTADSGFIYPTSPVPESPATNLLLAGLTLIYGIRRCSRKPS